MPADWTAAERPDPSDPEPARPEPDPVPWHDPGPPVRRVNLPPDSPSPGVPVENPELPPPRRP
jgi:hypothetical protein